jgi:hypothetical protein
MLDTSLIGWSGFSSGRRGLVKCKTVENEQLLTNEVNQYRSGPLFFVRIFWKRFHNIYSIA